VSGLRKTGDGSLAAWISDPCFRPWRVAVYHLLATKRPRSYPEWRPTPLPRAEDMMSAAAHFRVAAGLVGSVAEKTC